MHAKVDLMGACPVAFSPPTLMQVDIFTLSKSSLRHFVIHTNTLDPLLVPEW